MVSAGLAGAINGPDGKRFETLRISRCIITSEPGKAAKMQSVRRATWSPLMVMIT
jgi:hypothetical protein